MLRFGLLPYVGKVAVDLENSSIADRFAEVIARSNCEYELPAEVCAAAEDVLRCRLAEERRVSTPQSHLPSRGVGIVPLALLLSRPER